MLIKHCLPRLALTFLMGATLASPTLAQTSQLDQTPGLASAVAKSQRSFTVQNPLSVSPQYVAESPSQGYSVRFSSEGVLNLSTSKDSFGSRVVAYGKGADRGIIGQAQASLGKDENGWPAIRFQRSGLSEWFVNGEAGIQQWFQVAQRPSNSVAGPLWVRLSIGGAKGIKSLSEDAVQVQGTSSVLTYGGLKVWDANGRPLDARLVPSGNQVDVVVNDTSAVYPVTIDPTWTNRQQLPQSDPGANAYFGLAVAVEGDTAVVGSPSRGSGVGAAIIYKKTGSTWNQTQTVFPVPFAPGTAFGMSVAIVGGEIFVGSPGTASVYHYRPNGATYETSSVIRIPSGFLAGSGFGQSIAVDASRLVVGAPDVNVGQGLVFVYKRTANSFSVEAVVRPTEQRLRENFGFAVALDGDTILASSPYRIVSGIKAGVAFAFARSGTNWSQQRKFAGDGGFDGDGFGISLALKGDLALFGAPTSEAPKKGIGAAYVFERSGTNWRQLNRVEPKQHSDASRFGISVAFDPRGILVGDTKHANSEGNSVGSIGAVFIFERNGNSGNTFKEVKQLPAPIGSKPGGFGTAIAASDSNLLIGAPFDFSGVAAAGNVFAYDFLPETATMVISPNTSPIGGKTATLTLTLPTAPKAEFVVQLQSTSTLFPVPATMTFAPGETSKSISVKTLSTPVDTDVTVSASKTGYATVTNSFQVRFPRAGSVSFEPSATNPGGKTVIKRGETATGVVGLQAIAPVGGVKVTLVNPFPTALQCPDFVVIPEGQSRQTFTVKGLEVSKKKDVEISATPSFNPVSGKITVSEEADFDSLKLADPVIGRGGSTIGTVRIKAVAGVGGQVVDLSSDNPDVTVPAQVVIPEGDIRVNFNVNSVGTSGGRARISAHVSGSTLSTTITVQRPVLSKVTVSPKSVKGGVNSQVEVELREAAPKGGVTVELKSQKDYLAAVPATVFIPEGATKATAVITTKAYRGNPVEFAISARLAGDGYVGDKLTITE